MSAIRRSDRRLLLALVVARIALPMLTIHPDWEFHRDELLYFAMADHLTPLQMQFPPLIAIIAKVTTWALGDHVLSARLPAALGGGALLAVMLALAAQLGGGPRAAVLIALASIAAPVLLRASVLFQPVIFDQLWCGLAVTGVLLAAVRDNPRWWLLAGVAGGLGVLTKFSAAFYLGSLGVVALLMPSLRAQLTTRWSWLAAALVVIIGLPSLTGQASNGWPVLAQMAALRADQLDRIDPVEFLIEQPLLLGAASVPVAAGLWQAAKGDRAAAVAALFAATLVITMLLLHGKAYYAAPAYLALVVVGCRAIEDRPALRIGASVLLVIGAALLFPMGVPVFGPAAMARYSAWLGASAPAPEGGAIDLPQDYADMLGWREQAEVAGRVWRALTPAERQDAVLLGGNYGRAGALAKYRARYGLPYPASVHGDFHAWGLGHRSGRVVVVVADSTVRGRLEALYGLVNEVASIHQPRAVAEERDVRVFVARNPHRPLVEVWPELGPIWR